MCRSPQSLPKRPSREKPGQADKPAEPAAAKPADAAPAKPADEPAPTPKEFDDFVNAKPERKAALEADPELKGKVFGMARQLAKADEVLKLVPTRADAEFMQENTAAMVGLKTASMRLSYDPDSAPAVLDMLDSQFTVVDAAGKPVMGADGKPTFAPDRKPFIDAVVGRELTAHNQRFTSEIGGLKAKLAGGVYPNEAAKAIDQRRLDNLEYAQMCCEVLPMILSGEYFKDEAPEIPQDASPEFKAWAEAERKRIDDAAKALDDRKSGASKEQRQQARAQYQSAVRGDMGGVTGKIIGERLREIVDSGVYIPAFALQEKYIDPSNGQPTNTSALVARVFMKFENELMKPGSRTSWEIAQHELLPENDQTRAHRKDWYQRKAAEMIPDLLQEEVGRIQKLVEVDQADQAERARKRAAAAQPEPASAGSQLPHAATEEQLNARAEELAKAEPTFANASPGDKQAMIITKRHQLRRGTVK